LSYWTDTIKKVSKLGGPGNKFGAMAKKLVETPTEFPAGPSEVMIIADKDSNPRYIALDMLAQSEHDPLASSYLLTTSKSLAEKVLKEIENEVKLLPRKDILEESL
jgi:histidinol dehydrogenase